MTMREKYMTPRISKEKVIPVKKLGKKLENEPGLEFTKKLYQEFPKAEIYVVGGTVRDCMMGRDDSKDYDLVVRNVPAKELAKTLGLLGRLDLVGARFGVFKFVPRAHELAQAIDIALPRRDIAFGTGGYRDFETQSDPGLAVEEDLSRRDFTWNAMAWELRQGNLVDPFGGIFDLEAGLVRAVGKPEERFGEDYSRMLRAIRFAARFGFKIEPDTWQAIQKLASHIDDEKMVAGKIERIVPYEVIAREFLKALYADPLRALELYENAGLLLRVLPELEAMRACPQPPQFHREGDVWTHTKMALANLHSQGFKELFGRDPSPEVVFAVLLHDVGKPATLKTPEHDGANRIRFDGHDQVGAAITEKICERLKINAVPDIEIDTGRVVWLVRNHLFTLNTNLSTVRKTTLEKYFFNPQNPGQELLEVTYADATAAIPLTGEPDLGNLKKVFTLIQELDELRRERPALPKALLNGDEIMKILKLKPGPKVGKIILELREAQLGGRVTTKKEAAMFIKKNIIPSNKSGSLKH